MTDTAWTNGAEYAINETSRGDVGASSPALEHSEPYREVRAMSRCGHYTDSACADNPEHPENWRDAMVLRKSLVDEGWKTPNTYDNCFAYPIKGPAVYLFLLHGWETQDNFHNFDKALVAYVGMSKRLCQRWATHVILRDIQATGRYVQKWFLPTNPADLRAQEYKLIQKFDPPWNIQGRKRGVAL